MFTLAPRTPKNTNKPSIYHPTPKKNNHRKKYKNLITNKKGEPT